jgi:ferric-dicitrate binding protein FerR (iron transport regulator)
VPRLEFNATPLAEVVAMFNRHAASSAQGTITRLVLADVELATLPLSGMLRADNLAVLLQIMESSYGVQAEHRPDGEIILRKNR